MADRFPLIVDGSGTPAIKEIVSGDVLDLTGTTIKAVSVDTTLAVAGASTLTGNTTIGGTLGVTGVITGSLTGNVTGNVSGSAATVTTAAQPNITSVGTLTGLTTTGDINFGDNDKAIFGAGQDLQIYHTGSHSFVDDAGTGNLYIRGNSIILGKYTGEYSLSCTADGSTDLYYDNVLKLATTNTGATTTGLHTSTQSANISQVAITSSSNAVAWDSTAAANAYHVTTENTTFSAPSNAVEGAIISVELAQGGTARTVAWNTVFEFAASTAPTVTATANKTDIFSFRYNGSVWQEIGRVQNMAQT